MFTCFNVQKRLWNLAVWCCSTSLHTEMLSCSSCPLYGTSSPNAQSALIGQLPWQKRAKVGCTGEHHSLHSWRRVDSVWRIFEITARVDEALNELRLCHFFIRVLLSDSMNERQVESLFPHVGLVDSSFFDYGWKRNRSTKFADECIICCASVNCKRWTLFTSHCSLFSS